MPLPVITIAQTREWEKATWATGQSELSVIRRVGRAVAQQARQLTQANDLILIIAGKGHNGDDARNARKHLAERRVTLFNVAHPKSDLRKLERLLAARPALIIDGLFGIGLNRPLDQSWTQFIGRINQARLPVLAVDVPSGLDADTGEAQGAAIEAAVTLTVGAPKSGMLRPAAWRYVGRLEVAHDVGFAPYRGARELQWTWPGDFAGFPPSRPTASHKGTFGHLAIVAGSVGYHGAAVLAARGAQRAQPGLVSLFTHHPAYVPIASQLQAVMVHPWKPSLHRPGEFSAWLIGPGLASTALPPEMKSLARQLWKDSPLPVIVDASALDWVPPGAAPTKALRVLTPHPGEAGRLLKKTTAQVQADRPAALREISKKFGNSFVVLKGQHTLVGRADGDIFVNPSGNPFLAQGGSGDLLAGHLAGLLAQPVLQSDPLTTIRYAVWIHGAAADQLSATRKAWVVEELAEQIGSDARAFAGERV